jgi:hypothetical protein
MAPGPGLDGRGLFTISREMPGRAAARAPWGKAPGGKGVRKLFLFALATALTTRVSPVKFRGWGVKAGLIDAAGLATGFYQIGLTGV